MADTEEIDTLARLAKQGASASVTKDLERWKAGVVPTEEELRAERVAVDAPWRSYRPHPLADLLPMMDAETKAALSVSIRKQGFNPSDPIVMLDGKVLDGRNRLEVCKALDVEPTFREFDPRRDGDAFDFVLHRNVVRRQMTKVQLAVVALGLVVTTQGRPPKGGTCSTFFTMEQAAQRFGITDRYLRSVKAVLQHCDDDERARLRSGSLTLADLRVAKGLGVERRKDVEGPLVSPPTPEDVPPIVPLKDWMRSSSVSAQQSVQWPTVDLAAVRERLSSQPVKDIRDTDPGWKDPPVDDEDPEDEVIVEEEDEVIVEEEPEQLIPQGSPAKQNTPPSPDRIVTVRLPAGKHDAETYGRIIWQLRRVTDDYGLTLDVEEA